jgi:hypothetical protein
MVKIHLRDLRAALEDPAGYVQKHKNAGPTKMRATKYGVFRNAVFEFHSCDLQEAHNYLEDRFKVFKDQSDLAEYIVRLDAYAKDFKKLGTNIVQTRVNLALVLPDKFAGFRVSGQVARLDLSKGYNAWLFVRGDSDWSSDPRMPLLQDAIARKLNVELDEVEIGVYDFIKGGHYATKFKASHVQAVRKKLVRLLHEFTK